MTDNEIIKALECCTSDGCTCRECPYEDTKHIVNEEFETMSNGKTYDVWNCDEWLKIDLLDLINRQKAEIERLQNECFCIANERDAIKYCIDTAVEEAKAEAIKEFAAKVKQEAAYCDPITDEMIWLESNFDNLVKEMTE